MRQWMSLFALLAPLALFVPLALVAPSSWAQTDQRPEHFQGKASESMEQAFQNLAQYNKKMEALLKGELSNKDMLEIHKLSYTLEKALERIRQEVVLLAADLEHIHVASEKMDSKTIREKSPEYLRRSKLLLKK